MVNAQASGHHFMAVVLSGAVVRVTSRCSYISNLLDGKASFYWNCFSSTAPAALFLNAGTREDLQPRAKFLFLHQLSTLGTYGKTRWRVLPLMSPRRECWRARTSSIISYATTFPSWTVSAILVEIISLYLPSRFFNTTALLPLLLLSFFSLFPVTFSLAYPIISRTFSISSGHIG